MSVCCRAVYVQAHIPTVRDSRLISVISLHLLCSKVISQFDRAGVIFFYNTSCGVQSSYKDDDFLSFPAHDINNRYNQLLKTANREQ